MKDANHEVSVNELFSESYTLEGAELPYSPSNRSQPLVTFEIDDYRIEIRLHGKGRDLAVVWANLWEHTLLELEHLLLAVRAFCHGTVEVEDAVELTNWLQLNVLRLAKRIFPQDFE